MNRGEAHTPSRLIEVQGGGLNTVDFPYTKFVILWHVSEVGYALAVGEVRS